jgi:hypothetical protein
MTCDSSGPGAQFADGGAFRGTLDATRKPAGPAGRLDQRGAFSGTLLPND